MGRQDEVLKERIKKIEELKKRGFNPYPNKYEKKNTILECYNLKLNSNVKTAGRLMNTRDIGRIIFLQLKDNTGSIQIVLQKDETPDEIIEFFKKFIDSGDFIGVQGNIIKTKTGEISILANSMELLSKSILPLPSKFQGLKDKEERYRKRYVDLIMNEEVKKIFEIRSLIIKILRELLEEEGFLEVETPLLQPVYGGASAKPFVTHLNALDIDVYLSISPELYLKRLIVGGYEKVYTICKNFRNEGVDFQHNPEFTMMEYYAAYKDYQYHIEFTEKLYNLIKKRLKLPEKINYRGNEINLRTPFKRITFKDLLLQNINIDIDKENDFDKLSKAIKNKNIEGVDIDECSHYGALLDELYKRVIRPKIIQPTFLTHYPVEMIALAKRNEDDPSKINTVQLIIDGAEMLKAYDELNDPLDQEKRLQEQQNLLRGGDEEAMPFDQDFITALKYGMPPTAGYGAGIDRLSMFFSGQESIRDVIFFPFMKPENKVFVESKKIKKTEKELPINREQAIRELKKYNSEEADLNHYFESEAVMKNLAKFLGEDEEYWAMIGLLHDIDWGITKENVHLHLTKAPKILREIGFENDFIETIVSHGYGFKELPNLEKKERSKKIEYALASSETITGLIHAYALMRGKKVSDMDVLGLKKKFKDKNFASKVNREVILECEKIGVPLDKFFEISINAIKEIKDEVGLK